jgi:outer membrane protein
MRVKVSVFVVLILVIFLTWSTGARAASPKFGYFDLQTIMDKSTAGQQAKADFKREADKLKLDLEQRSKDFKALRDEFEKKKSVLDEAARNKKLKELQEKQAEGEKFATESNAKFNKLTSDYSQPIVDKILEIVRRIGKDEKYDYIFEAQKGGIAFANDKDDLTLRLIDELNKTVINRKP